MSPTPFQIWFGVLAAILHLILGSLSTDGGASLLARYTAWRFPAKALPLTILACSIAAGVVDGVVNGVAPLSALATALMVAIASAGGAVGHHALVSAGTSSVVVWIGGAIFAVLLEGCALFTPANVHKAEAVVADSATCLVSKQDLPDATAFAECGIQEAEKLLATQRLHAMRAETAKAAAAAASIATHDAKLGCGAR